MIEKNYILYINRLKILSIISYKINIIITKHHVLLNNTNTTFKFPKHYLNLEYDFFWSRRIKVHYH